MEDKICSIAKNWSANTFFDTSSLNIFDTNGNTILRCGEFCVPEKDASVIKSLLTSSNKKAFTVEVFKNHYICMINNAGLLIGRSGFNISEHNENNDDKIKATRNEKIERDISRIKEHNDGTRYRHRANDELAEYHNKKGNADDLNKTNKNEDQTKEVTLKEQTQTPRTDDQDDHDDNPVKYKSIGSEYTDRDIPLETIAAGVVSGFVLVVSGMSRDGQSILRLLKDSIRSLTETNMHHND